MILSNSNLDRSRFSQKADLELQLYESINPDRELPVFIRYMFYRSSESRSSSDPKLALGQDYLEWHDDNNADEFNFVVCDGVGQSFLGYIASRFLGQKIMDWLKGGEGPRLIKAYARGTTTTALGEKIAGELRSWHDAANNEVQKAEIPSTLPPMVQTALEDIRATHGSETVFVAGHLSIFESQTFLVLFWMGDVRFRLFCDDWKEITTDIKWVNSERWSTKNDLKGRGIPNVKIYNLKDEKITRIMAYSDGLSTIENEIPNLTSQDLQYKANQLLVSPSSDDISFIDISLDPTDNVLRKKFTTGTQNRGALPQWLIHQKKIDPTQYELAWDELKDEVVQYIILEKESVTGLSVFVTSDSPWREVFRSTTQTSYVVKDRVPGQYQYKLQVIYKNTGIGEGPICTLDFEKIVQIVNTGVSTSIGNSGGDASLTNPTSLAPSSINMQGSAFIPPQVPDQTIPFQDQVASGFISYNKSSLSNSDAVQLVSVPEWDAEPFLDFKNRTVLLRWKPIVGVDEFSISFLDAANKGAEKNINIRGTEYLWDIKNWSRSSYNIRIKALGHAPRMPSEAKTVDLAKFNLPTPILSISRSFAKVGETIFLECNSSGQNYPNGCEYQWQYRDSRVAKDYQTISSGMSSSFQHTLSKAGKYYYQVQVKLDNEVIVWSQATIVEVEDLLTKPQIVEPHDGDQVGLIFTLKWLGDPVASKYDVEYLGKSAFFWEKYKLNRAPSLKGAYWQCDLDDNHPGEWRFRVKAHDKRGREESISDEIKITIENNKHLKKSIKIKDEPVIDPNYKGCTITWEQSKASMYSVFVYKENKNISIKDSVTYENKLWISLPTPGTYYFGVVESSKTEPIREPKTTDLKEFILPLKPPCMVINPYWIESKLNNVSGKKISMMFSRSTYANYYVIDIYINGQKMKNYNINDTGQNIEIELEPVVGNFTIQIKACSSTFSVESPVKEIKFDVEKDKYSGFQIINFCDTNPIVKRS